MKKLLFLLFLFCFRVYSQEPISIHLSKKEGLPDNEIYLITEDEKGFIWLAADKGLFRYDGKNFKTYTNKNKRGHSVFGVKTDVQNRVWCTNISGQFFYVENDTLTTFIDLKDTLKGELADFIVTKSSLLVFSKDHIFAVDLKTKATTSLVSKTELVGVPYYFNNELLVTIGDKLIRIDDANSLVELNVNSAFLPYYLKTCFFSNKNHLYTVSRNKNRETNFYKVLKNSVQKLEKPSEIANKSIVSFFSKNNETWLATDKGIVLLEIENTKLKYKNTFFKNEYVTKILPDKQGNIWVSTLRNGIFIMPNSSIKKTAIPKEISDINYLQKIEKNRLIFGTTDGRLSFYNTDLGLEKTIALPKQKKISSIYYQSQKNKAIISLEQYAYVLNTKTNHLNETLNYINVKSFSGINNNKFLYAVYNVANVAQEVETKTEQKTLEKKRAYFSYFSTKSSTGYVAYVDEFKSYDHNENPTSISFKNQAILGKSVTETSDGIVWVATFKNQLIGIKNNKVVKDYEVLNATASEAIKKINGDGDFLWILTDKKIQYLNTKTGVSKILTERDGLVTYDITDFEVFDSDLIFSTSNGLFTFNKQEVFKERNIPSLYFNQISINEKESLLKSAYVLPDYENTIKIGYHVNGFQTRDNIVYQYKMDGLDKDWIYSDSSIDFVKYNSLPAGKYTFMVKASNLSLNESSSVKKIQFTIVSPFWKKPWFFILIMLVFGCLIAAFYTRKIKRREKEKNLLIEKSNIESQLTALKLENLRSQMNPHFIFNALNSIQEYIVLNQKDLASNYLGKFADLIRIYLNNSAKKSISLQEEITALEMYLELEKMRFEEKFAYTINIASNLPVNHIKIPTMLIQPYVENAIKHGLLHIEHSGKLEIGFSYSKSKNEIICNVEDNGIGRNKSLQIQHKNIKRHQPFATAATQNRLTLLNDGSQHEIGVEIIDLFDGENISIGTKVVLRIPFTE